MSDVQLYIIEHEKDKKEATRIAHATSAKLQTKQLKLIDLIVSLGEYLNHEDAAIRGKTISFLAEVLQSIPPKVLTRQDCDLLSGYIMTRIADDPEAINAGAAGSSARASLALEDLGGFDQDRAEKIMTAFLDHTYPLTQFKLQSERHSILLLIDRLFSKYREAIHSLHQASHDFLPKLVGYFDGEKDPRNLMIVFSLLRVVGSEWDVSSCAEDLFNASFNYFPITFRPPPDDPYGITADELKERLKLCISASASFAPYSFPALLDKLDSTSINTKRDVLRALFCCVNEYGPPTVNLYSVTLWDALKYEVLSVQEEDLAEESLKVLGEIALQLSRGPADSLTTYLKPVAKECNQHLEDAPTKQSQGATRMLKAIAASCAPACNHLLVAILPNLFSIYQSTQDLAKRRSLIETLTHLVRADTVVFGEWRRDLVTLTNGTSTIHAGSSTNALADFSAKALEVLNAALSVALISQVSYRLILLDALLHLTKVRALLKDEQISQIIGSLDQIVISEDSYGKDDVKAAAVDALVEIAHQKPQLIIDKCFPDFLGRLPDKDEGDPSVYFPILEAFAKLGSEEAVFGTVVLRLKNKLNTAIQMHASPSYLQSILAALLYAFDAEAKKPEPNATFISALSELVIPLIQKLCKDTGTHQGDDATFYLLGKLTNVVLRSQSSEEQSEPASHIYTLWLDTTQHSTTSLDVVSATFTDKRAILSTFILAALRKDSPLPIDLTNVLPLLVHAALKEPVSHGVNMALLEQITIICNKFIPSNQLNNVVMPLLQGEYGLLARLSSEPASTRITFAILKGLILRNAPGLTDIFTALISKLADAQSGTNVAHGLATLLQPEDIITKENHCTILALHKQKTFAMLVPGITTGFRNVDASAKKNYLIALAGIVRSVPYAVLEPQLSALVPLCLQTLSIEGEDDVKAGTIETLATALTENPPLIEAHANSLINRLLSCAASKANSAHVRAKALACLTLLASKLRRELVIPHRKQVIKNLTAPLDDPKRAVRLEAVRCRKKWLELDDAGDDDD